MLDYMAVISGLYENGFRHFHCACMNLKQGIMRFFSVQNGVAIFILHA
jgi:hypothetical protein